MLGTKHQQIIELTFSSSIHAMIMKWYNYVWQAMEGALAVGYGKPHSDPCKVVHDISYVMRYIMNASIIYSCK